jgi:hypothetical protein
MKYIQPNQLRKIIFDIISPTIDMYRESKGDFFWTEFNQYVSEKEIEDFINSTPYFDAELKSFISFQFYNEKNVLVPNSWENLFIQKVYLWSESFEWLFGDVKYMCEPNLNISNNIKNNAEILSLPESLEQIKIRNFFTSCSEL